MAGATALSSSATVLAGHTSSVWTCPFSNTGTHIATSSSDETVRVWSLAPNPVRGQEVACLTGHEGVVRGCDFSPDSTLLASCSWDKSVHVYTTSNFMLKHQLLGHKYGVASVRFSPGGMVLASCSWDDTIRLWDVETGSLLTSLQGHTSPVANCIFLEGESVLATCSWDGKVKLWDLSSLPQRAAAAVVTLSGHPDAVYDLAATPLEPHLLVSCGRKGALVLWDIRQQAVWQALQSSWQMELNCVTFSPTSPHFLVGDNMGELQRWDLPTIKVSSIHTIPPKVLAAHASSVGGVSYSASGDHFATCSNDYTCRVWEDRNSFDQPVNSLADTLASQLSLSGHSGQLS